LTKEAYSKGFDLPERIRQSLAAAVASRGVQARVISTQDRESMRPPQGHIIVAAPKEEVDGSRGPARIVRRLEFYKTPYGPVVRLAFSVYPEDGYTLSAETLLNVSQVSGDAALSGFGRQQRLYMHFYYATEDGDLAYGFSKELANATELTMARDAYLETPEERRSFRWAVGLAESRFKLPVPEPDE
jgi:hypothetical protein